MVHGDPPRISRGSRADPAPMHSFGSSAERDAVKDFGNDFCRFGDRHSGTVEEQIAVRKRDVTVSHRAKIPPPRISLQHALFPQTPLQVESAGSHYQALRISIAKRSLAETREALRLELNIIMIYGNLARLYLRLNRLDEAKATLDQGARAQAR